MRTALDTNVLISLFNAEPTAARVAEALFYQRQRGSLTIAGQVYGELCVVYEVENLTNVLFDHDIEIDFRMEGSAWQLASDRWRQYLRNRRNQTTSFPCPNCGHENTFTCENCNHDMGRPRLMLADFTIGAHALTYADQLVTFDRGVYATYFPELKVINPVNSAD